MLILFKPWYNVSDLCPAEHTWSEAFTAFSDICDPSLKRVIDNMQILHECKDSCDDHFAKMSSLRRSEMNCVLPGHLDKAVDVEDNFLAEEGQDQAILEHLEAIDSTRSTHAFIANKNVQDCISSVQLSGMYDVIHAASSDNIRDDVNSVTHEVFDDNPVEENIWKDAYNNRKQNWKKRRYQILLTKLIIQLVITWRLPFSIMVRHFRTSKHQNSMGASFPIQSLLQLTLIRF